MTLRRRRGSEESAERHHRGRRTPNPRLQNELLERIAAGTHEFEAGDRAAAAELQALQATFNALESLASAGMITIGSKVTVRSDTDLVIVAVRRLRITEAGKRHMRAIGSKGGSP